MPETGPDRCHVKTVFAGEAVILDAGGALYLPDHRTLVASDLHLEKGSFFAARGNPLPCHDTRDTLARLVATLKRYRPERFIALGDSFHDAGAGRRMMQDDTGILSGLVASCADWVWVAGNHDPQISPAFGGRSVQSECTGRITFVHRPEDAAPPLIAGHYHPKHHVRAAGRRVSGRCFLVGEALLLMPAFGAYAGGLSIQSEAISQLYGASRRRVMLLYGAKIWTLEEA